MAVFLAEFLGLYCLVLTLKRLTKEIPKQTCINKKQLKKSSSAKIYQKSPGWAENT